MKVGRKLTGKTGGMMGSMFCAGNKKKGELEAKAAGCNRKDGRKGEMT